MNLRSIPAFNGQTFIQNMLFRFAASGGMLLGGNTGGSAGVHVFKTDHLVLLIALDGETLGSTLAFVHLLNTGYTGSDVAERGTQIFLDLWAVLELTGLAWSFVQVARLLLLTDPWSLSIKLIEESESTELHPQRDRFTLKANQPKAPPQTTS